MDNPLVDPVRHPDRTPHVPSMEEYRRLYRLSLDAPELFWA